jgi:hypothetical protein
VKNERNVILLLCNRYTVLRQTTDSSINHAMHEAVRRVAPISLQFYNASLPVFLLLVWKHRLDPKKCCCYYYYYCRIYTVQQWNRIPALNCLNTWKVHVASMSPSLGCNIFKEGVQEAKIETRDERIGLQTLYNTCSDRGFKLGHDFISTSLLRGADCACSGVAHGRFDNDICGRW